MVFSNDIMVSPRGVTEATIAMSSLMPSTTYSIQAVNTASVGVYSDVHTIQKAGEQWVVYLS